MHITQFLLLFLISSTYYFILKVEDLCMPNDFSSMTRIFQNYFHEIKKNNFFLIRNTYGECPKIVKGYLRYKIVFRNKVTLDV